MKNCVVGAILLLAASLTGCYKVTVFNNDTSPQAGPVVLTWDSDPVNGQPNPGTLPVASGAEFTFITPNIHLEGYDPNFPNDVDSIDLTLTEGKNRVVSWDGFTFTDQGDQRTEPKGKALVSVKKPSAVKQASKGKKPGAP